MALFLTRLLVEVGVTLPSGASQGFNDISGFDAATQTAINQLRQLGISLGTTTTTFAPNLEVPRWQMALFLARSWTPPAAFLTASLALSTTFARAESPWSDHHRAESTWHACRRPAGRCLCCLVA